MTLADLGIVPGECRIVAEIGPARGSVDWAVRAVDAAAATKAVHFVKGQFYDRERLVTRTAKSYAQSGVREPATQYEHFAEQLSYVEWRQVQDRCEQHGLTFFASVFDFLAVDDAEAMNLPLLKIASADITHKPLLEYAAQTGLPIVLSTGGATLGEIQRAYQWIAAIDPTVEVLPLMCTLSYPTPPDRAHIARIGYWREHVNDMVGYSDHTEGISAMLTARDEGAVMIEKHFTITPGIGGDHDFAANPTKFEVFNTCPPGVPGPNFDVEMGSAALEPHPIEYQALQNARRSVAAVVDIPAGNIIGVNDVTWLRPGTGAYEPWQTDRVVGQAAPVDIPAGTLIPLLGQPGQTAAQANISATLTVE